MIISNTLYNFKNSKSLNHFIIILRENPITFFAFLMLFFFLITAIFGPYLVPYDPLETNAKIALQPPSIDHLFGTDNLGRDVFSRVITATRLDLTISVLAVLMSFIIGVIVWQGEHHSAKKSIKTGVDPLIKSLNFDI